MAKKSPTTSEYKYAGTTQRDGVSTSMCGVVSPITLQRLGRLIVHSGQTLLKDKRN